MTRLLPIAAKINCTTVSVKNLISRWRSLTNSTILNHSSFSSELFDASSDQLEPDSKRLKLRLLSYFFDYDQNPASSLERELREYMAAPPAPETTQPAEYWRWSPLSQLATLARSVLALPLGWSPVQTVLVTDHHKIQGLQTHSLKQTEQTIFLNVNKKLW